jgi:NAD(P)-dependent dehydrogenase (short-subunit alcohol dehydrogenase family)
MKTAVITGGNSGIGKAVALDLAKKGYRVIIHGKDEAKAKAAMEEIKEKSGNAAVEYIVADVSVISGMKDLAEAIKRKTDKIDALVLSTGIILTRYELTADDLEKGFAVQYLSRFALTQFLLKELKNGNAKIVLVGATKIRNAKVYLDNLALKNNFTMIRAMAQEMFCNHLFVQEFAKRHPASELVINMGHVGVAKTGITRHLNFFLRLLIEITGTSPEKSAANFTYLASADEVNFSGYFFKKPGNTSVKEKIQYDPILAEGLWNKSMELIKKFM